MILHVAESLVRWKERGDGLPCVLWVRDPLLVLVGFGRVALTADDCGRRRSVVQAAPRRPAHGSAIGFRDEFPAVSALSCHRKKQLTSASQPMPRAGRNRVDS